jgi:predicted ATPase
MGLVDFLSIKAKNLKCFGDEPQGFEAIKPFNVIIGRNNTGKTTLLDLVEFVKRRTADEGLGHRGKHPTALVTIAFTQDFINSILTNDPHLTTPAHAGILNNCLKDRTVSWSLGARGDQDLVKLEPTSTYDYQMALSVVDRALNEVLDEYHNTHFVRLAADRDIRAELDQNPLSPIHESDFNAAGDGATRVLQRMLNNNIIKHRQIIEQDVLHDLNSIYGPDGQFTRIMVLRLPSQKNEERWEVHLENESGLTIPMSRMGSGVKTILLVLMCIHIVPQVIHRQPLSSFMFGFEELENNLHPAIQKRLFLYLRGIVKDHKCRFFLTTHSHIVIDLFSRDDMAQIIHVTHGREKDTALVETVIDSAHHGKVFEDLDVRASDLLQSNCVIWVEGPSDRIYLTRWIRLVDPGLQEHVDYEFAFTSGTLLAHQTFDTQEEELIQAIRINRNAIVLMDRDKKDGELKRWVERVEAEVSARGGLAWVTAGKEIENYIPVEALRLLLKKPDLEAPDAMANMFDFIAENGGPRYEKKKPELATKIGEIIDGSMLARMADLEEKILEVCHLIRRWNGRADR